MNVATPNTPTPMRAVSNDEATRLCEPPAGTGAFLCAQEFYSRIGRVFSCSWRLVGNPDTGFPKLVSSETKRFWKSQNAGC
jgi:hypothetical protein